MAIKEEHIWTLRGMLEDEVRSTIQHKERIDALKLALRCVTLCQEFSETLENNGRPKGKWTKYDTKGFFGLSDSEYECSNCDMRFEQSSKFCPECGADMRGDDHDSRIHS